VVKKHDFRGIQQKIPQNSDFAKKQDLNPVPNGEVAADIANMFAKKFAKIIFCIEKHNFCGNLIGKLQNSLHPTAKIGFHKKFYPIFAGISPTIQFLQKNDNFDKNANFREKC
jgi:hypothetical protein